MAKETAFGIWVFAEQKSGSIEPTVYELLAKAKELGAEKNEPVTAVLLGYGLEPLAGTLIASGADTVLIGESESLCVYSPRTYQQAMSELAKKYEPSIILFGATPLGRELAPRIMVSLDTGLTADAIDLGFDGEGEFYQTTPAFGGSAYARIVISRARPQMVTVRPRVFTPLVPDSERQGNIVKEQLDIAPDEDWELIGAEPKKEDEASIEKAPVIVAAGRGVKTEKELASLRELAGLLGGGVAGSRPFIESGLLPHSCQIGQSGATVKPELIINVAISGSVQYKVGMQNSKRVLSINTNRSAPIFDFSDYGAQADFRELIPALNEELKKRKRQREK